MGLRLFVTAGCVGLAAAAGYPSVYPLANEIYVPPDMLSSEPDFTYAADDAGGYPWYASFSLSTKKGDFNGGAIHDFGGTLVDEYFPYVPHLSGCFIYLAVNTYGAPVQGGWPWADESWNCTEFGHFYGSGDFTGEVNGKRVCQVGSCCSTTVPLAGKMKYADDQLDWHSWLNDKVKLAVCETPIEEVYCVMVDGHSHFNCFEYWPGPTDRYVVLPCMDMLILSFMECVVYKTKYSDMYEIDSPVYRARNSDEGNMVLDAGSYMPDKICHPYSYYYTADGGCTKECAGAGDNDGGDDSAASVAFASFVAIAAFLF